MPAGTLLENTADGTVVNFTTTEDKYHSSKPEVMGGLNSSDDTGLKRLGYDRFKFYDRHKVLCKVKKNSYKKSIYYYREGNNNNKAFNKKDVFALVHKDAYIPHIRAYIQTENYIRDKIFSLSVLNYYNLPTVYLLQDSFTLNKFNTIIELQMKAVKQKPNTEYPVKPLSNAILNHYLKLKCNYLVGP